MRRMPSIVVLLSSIRPIKGVGEALTTSSSGLCYLYNATGVEKPTAEAFCLARGMVLASFETEQELSGLLELIQLGKALCV